MTNRQRHGRWVLAVLVGVYPSAFFAMTNWYAFGANQIGLLVVAVPLTTGLAFGLLFSALGRLAGWRARRRQAAQPEAAIDGISTALGLSAGFLLLWSPLSGLAIPPALLGAGIAAVVLVAGAWARARGLSHINVALGGLLAKVIQLVPGPGQPIDAAATQHRIQEILSE